jgi:hypothetical protein
MEQHDMPVISVSSHGLPGAIYMIMIAGIITYRYGTKHGTKTSQRKN